MDDLQRELGRLETRLAEATPGSRVIDELAAMRGELDRPQQPGPPSFKLASLRVASPCKERWAGMTGDDRVRVCNGCERPVFNLSEMTRDQAEAVLATRGIKPCVRFYQRVDGTVMTADCPTGPRRSPRLTVIAAGAMLASSPALADETPTETEPTEPTADKPTTDDDQWTMGDPVVDDDDWTMGVLVEPEAPKHATVEWSTWARLGYGVAMRPQAIAARSSTPLMPVSSELVEGALGADVTIGIARDGAMRLGAWAEWRTVSQPVLGGELIVGGVPLHSSNMVIVLRAGGNADVVTGALGAGFARDSRPGFGHASGIRVVNSVTVDDAETWSVTLGIEVDPIGTLGYLVNLATR